MKKMTTIICPYEFCIFRDTKDCVDNRFGCLKSNMSDSKRKDNKEEAQNPKNSRQ